MKIDLSKIVTDTQKLYAKDKKAVNLIGLGSDVKTAYAAKDVIVLGEGHPIRAVTGLLGLPFNKIAQVAGRPDCGKSTAAAELMVAAQEQDVTVILWDTEDKFDSNRFTMMGGDPANVLLVKTNEILRGAELVRKYILAVKEQDANAKILFVWDSIGGSQSRSHSERELDSEKHGQPGQDAKENSSVMKVVIGLINKYPDTIAVYMANQVYAKIGFMMKGDAIPGGSKIEFHSSLIIMLRRIKVLTKKEKGVEKKKGIITRATVVKNHLSQGDTSVHKQDFEITALGYAASADMIEDEEEDTEE